MNFVFVSPHFPLNYYLFAVALKKNGVNVLGIGDCPFDSLRKELRESLADYYQVSNLEDYEEMRKAIGYFIYKHGKIDWIESNNEYWLEQDARLRTDFNVNTGLKSDEINRYKLKSEMKKYYALADVPFARYKVIKSYDDCQEFVKEVGYPVIVKPNNGVGASDTRKIKNDEELSQFFAHKRNIDYIMEEYVDGYIRTFDGVSDSLARPIYYTSHVETDSPMDVVNEGKAMFYYIDKNISPKMREAGEKTLLAFQAKNRFFHCEFFIANSDHPLGRWKKGDVLGLEVNMRPAGGYTVDMEDFAGSVNLYQVWADMVAFGKNHQPLPEQRQYCGYVGKRDNGTYLYSHEQIMEKYKNQMKMHDRIPPALADEMGDVFYIANFDDLKDAYAFANDVLKSKEDEVPFPYSE